jgi:hypothetical protein
MAGSESVAKTAVSSAKVAMVVSGEMGRSAVYRMYRKGPRTLLNKEKQPNLSNRHTNWDDFRHLINERLTLNVSYKNEEDIEAAVKFFNDTIQWAGWNTTPEHTDTLKTYSCQKSKKKKKTQLRLAPITNTRKQKST